MFCLIDDSKIFKQSFGFNVLLEPINIIILMGTDFKRILIYFYIEMAIWELYSIFMKVF